MTNIKYYLATSALLASISAHSQFAAVPTPLQPAEQRSSEAEIAKEYRIDAARHIYAAYPTRIHRGKLPPLMYAIMLTDIEVGPDGAVVNVVVTREPAAAKEVTPWVVALIRRAAPFPRPAKFNGNVVFKEIWLVDRSGNFQVDTLTEGQRDR